MKHGDGHISLKSVQSLLMKHLSHSNQLIPNAIARKVVPSVVVLTPKDARMAIAHLRHNLQQCKVFPFQLIFKKQ